MSERTAHSQSGWVARREARARQAWFGTAAAVGALLAVVGVVLGLVVAFKRDALGGSAFAVISAMLGILIVLVASLYTEGERRP